MCGHPARIERLWNVYDLTVRELFLDCVSRRQKAVRQAAQC